MAMDQTTPGKETGMKEYYVHANSKWHSLPYESVFERLESGEDGISRSEAEARLDEYGRNALPETKKTSALFRFFKQFHDILIYILFISAFITLMLGHYADTAVILVVTLVNALIGFFQERKADKALADIKAMLSPKASAIRNGLRSEIDASELVIGDIVSLKPGARVPADLRLIRAYDLKIEESALTGEALASDKTTAPLDPGTLLGDRSNMAYSGTFVKSGTGAGVVVATGLETELGRISQLLAETPPPETPLVREMARFGKHISAIIIVISVAVYAFGHFFRDYHPAELLLATIGLAIAAIPEGLPAMLSIILAIGVRNMAKRKAIVRNLPAVETLGSVSVICSDKTGTLTQNEMTVTSLMTQSGIFEVTGTNGSEEGAIEKDGQRIKSAEHPLLRELLSCFSHCNEAVINRDADGVLTANGEPTEVALAYAVMKDADVPEKQKRLAMLPFDSEHKYMASLHDGGEHNVIFIKGAPDKLLFMSQDEQGVNRLQRTNIGYWENGIASMAAQGGRVLGAAMKIVDKTVSEITHESLEQGVVFLGLASIMDPPRPEAILAVESCKQAGILIKMITGDHAVTAVAIGQKMGIGDGDHVLTGRDLDDMSPEQLRCAVRIYDIFARTTPEDKLKLVRAIQEQGLVCAMTGDGVNDAPALKMADIGIAMGIKGTEVSKGSAEIVLADDNFESIAAAVEEGRRIYDNLKKTILFILPTNGAESLLIIASILFGTAIPLLPVQILWVNMVTSVTVSLALVFEQTEADVMKRPPRPAGERIMNLYFTWRIFFVSTLMAGLTLLMSQVLLSSGYAEELVRTLTLQTIVFCQLFHLFNSRSIRTSAFVIPFFSNSAVFVVSGLLIALQLAVTYIPFMNGAFGTVPVPAHLWGIPLLLGLVVFFAVEWEKFFMRLLDKHKKRNGQELGIFERTEAECRTIIPSHGLTRWGVKK